MRDFDIERKNEDGDTMVFRVAFSDGIYWFPVFRIIPRDKRRKPTEVFNIMNGPFRGRSAEDKHKMAIEELLKYTSVAMLNEVLHEVWTTMQPPRIESCSYE